MPETRTESGADPLILIGKMGSAELARAFFNNVTRRSVTIERSNSPSKPRATGVASHPCLKPNNEVKPRDKALVALRLDERAIFAGSPDSGGGVICTSIVPIFTDGCDFSPA